MKLNFGFIAELMSDRCRYINMDEFDECIYTSISPYVADRAYESDIIYALEWSTLSTVETAAISAVVCIGGGADAQALLSERGINGLIVDGGENLLNVICDIQAIFSKYNGLELELMNLLSRDASTDAILNKCSDFFNAHLTLYDANFSLIAYSTNYLPGEEDKLWAETLKNRRCVIKMVTRNRVQLLPSFPDKYPKATFINIDDVPAHFNYGFDYGDYRYATFVINETAEPLKLSQHWMVDNVAEMISFKIYERYNTRIGIREHLRLSIQNMLLHKSSDVMRPDSGFNVLGWKPTDIYRMLIVSLSKESASISHYLYNYENIFSDMYSHCIALHFEQNIIILLHDQAVELSKTQIETLANQVRLDKAVCCIGIPFKSYMQITQQYLITLNTFCFYPNDDPVRYCREIIPYLVTSELNYLFPVRSVCHCAATVLFDYDKENSTHLLETLKIYLLCNKSLVGAAARLYVHKSTITYRLKCIEKICTINFDDPIEQAHLLFSCIALENLVRFERV